MIGRVARHSRRFGERDSDFLRLHAAGLEHAGIAYCHQQSRSLGEIILGLALLWDVYDPDEMKNRVEYL